MSVWIQPHHMATRCNIDREHAVRVIRWLSKETHSPVRTLIYHHCCECPVAVVDEGATGTVNCDDCEEPIDLATASKGIVLFLKTGAP